MSMVVKNLQSCKAKKATNLVIMNKNIDRVPQRKREGKTEFICQNKTKKEKSGENSL